MFNPLAQKLEAFVDLAADDRAELDRLCASQRRYKAGRNLIKEGDRPGSVFLLLAGWACRYKILRDGSRQIVAYLVPGDLCDIHIFILKEMDHSIGLLSEALVAEIDKDAILALIDKRPHLGRALFWATLVDEATLREWLVNLGQRDAFERVAHLFCELCVRMEQVGLVTDNVFELPLTQEQLGDTVGITPVHANRVLQRMRAEGLIVLSQKQLAIQDMSRLRAIAQFDPNYLHLDRRK